MRLRDSAAFTFFLYGLAFAGLCAPWLRVASHAAPLGARSNAADEWLVVWILAWIGHSLVANPLGVLDAPINYPAPSQLTGSEHLATAQIAFAPVYWATHNPVLAANIAVFITYPLAACAMDRLLRRLGVIREVAWVGGLVLALGPLQVPAHLHLIQYSNLFLPATCLMLTRLRERVDLRRAAAFALVFALSLLSSYYIALMTCLAVVAWTLFEVSAPRTGRVSFLLSVALSAGLGFVPFIVVSLPYLVRPEFDDLKTELLQASMRKASMLSAAAYMNTMSAGRLILAICAIGVSGLVLAYPSARRCAWRGLILILIAQSFMPGPAVIWDHTLVPTPYALLVSSAGAFFRYPFRFVVLLGFGVALLSAAALEVVWRRYGRWVGGVSSAGIAIALILNRGLLLTGDGFREFPDLTEPIYDRLVRIAGPNGQGPVLELPVVAPVSDPEGGYLGTEVRGMLAATRHWLPLVTGFTGYVPPHRRYLDWQIWNLPSTAAWDAIVDMTHIRWVVLRPIEQWPKEMRTRRDGIARMRGLRQVADENGWGLFAVTTEPPKESWFGAVAAGSRADQTIFGTPLVRLEENTATATTEGTIPDSLPRGRASQVQLEIANIGTATWPVVPADKSARTNVVNLVAHWRLLSGSPEKANYWQQLPLARDLRPGEKLSGQFNLFAPPTAGAYELEVQPSQFAGAAFRTPGNVPLRHVVEVGSE